MDMNVEEFRKFAKTAVDYVADYLENIRDRPVLPSVEPGYLQKLIPKEMPQHPEKWQDILSDMDRVIMPGITHWQSPQFHAYFPSASSYPSLVGEILSNGIAALGFNWATSPACTELEVITMDWLAKLLGLPEHFVACNGGPGGGVIQGSASESTLVTLLAARENTTRKLKEKYPHLDEGAIRAKLVAYSSDQSNSSIEKSGVLGAVIMRLLPSDDKCRLKGETLQEAIRTDRENGLFPFYMVANIGTTGTCAFDNLEELGSICTREDIWMHVDAAYAGAAFVCPEFRHLMAGIEHADSFCFNPHKWLLVNFECSALWVRDSSFLVEAFNVDRIYLRHKNQALTPDYRHWQIPLGRRFRALKVWFVLRAYGVKGLQDYIRRHVSLAQEFETLVRQDCRFEVVTERVMALVCFRLKGSNQLTRRLHDRLLARKKIYVIPATYQEKYIIRFVVNSRITESRDITFAWEEIRSQADFILNSCKLGKDTQDPTTSIHPQVSVSHSNGIKNIELINVGKVKCTMSENHDIFLLEETTALRNGNNVQNGNYALSNIKNQNGIGKPHINGNSMMSQETGNEHKLKETSKINGNFQIHPPEKKTSNHQDSKCHNGKNEELPDFGHKNCNSLTIPPDMNKIEHTSNGNNSETKEYRSRNGRIYNGTQLYKPKRRNENGYLRNGARKSKLFEDQTSSLNGSIIPKINGTSPLHQRGETIEEVRFLKKRNCSHLNGVNNEEVRRAKHGEPRVVKRKKTCAEECDGQQDIPVQEIIR